jgi:hypothetical protein
MTSEDGRWPFRDGLVLEDRHLLIPCPISELSGFGSPEIHSSDDAIWYTWNDSADVTRQHGAKA